MRAREGFEYGKFPIKKKKLVRERRSLRPSYVRKSATCSQGRASARFSLGENDKAFQKELQKLFCTG